MTFPFIFHLHAFVFSNRSLATLSPANSHSRSLRSLRNDSLRASLWRLTGKRNAPPALRILEVQVSRHAASLTFFHRAVTPQQRESFTTHMRRIERDAASVDSEHAATEVEPKLHPRSSGRAVSFWSR